MTEPEKEVVEEKTETQVAEDLFTEGFEAAISETPVEPGTITENKEEAKPPEEKKIEEKVEVKPDENAEKIKNLEKSVEDTKRWGTERATEAANLKKRLEALEAKTPEKEPEPSDTIKKLYEDYPEFKEAIAYEVKRLVKQETPTSEIPRQVIGELINNLSLMTFREGIIFGFADDKGNWIEGHPDGIKIIQSKEFRDWTEKEKIDTTTEEYNYPAKAIETISRFKEAKVKGALSEKDKAEAKEKEEKQNAAGAMISTTKGARTSGKSVDKDDYQGGWDEAIRS